MSTVDMIKIQKLVQQKRFGDVVFEVESTTSENNRSAILHNLLGVCRASQKGKTDRDVQYALDDFEKAFYKDNLGQISLDALCSHITLCAEMGRKENDLVNNFLTKLFSKSLNKSLRSLRDKNPRPTFSNNLF